MSYSFVIDTSGAVAERPPEIVAREAMLQQLYSTGRASEGLNAIMRAMALAERNAACLVSPPVQF